MKFYVCLFVLLGFGYSPLHSAHEQHIVVVIPSYNNAKWCERNLLSVLDQDYENFDVIYMNDCSDDATSQMVQDIIATHPKGDKVTLVNNNVRCRQLRNTYYAIHWFCDDDDIVCIVDGDDWLNGKDVFKLINSTYGNKDIWFTHGSFKDSTGAHGKRGQRRRIARGRRTGKRRIGKRRIGKRRIGRRRIGRRSKAIKIDNTGRQLVWWKHMRTFRAWLFKMIPLQDLLYQGAFFPSAADAAVMYPLSELSGGRFCFIKNHIYIYNVHNQLNIFRNQSCRNKQTGYARYIASQAPRTSLVQPIPVTSLITMPIKINLCILIDDFTETQLLYDCLIQHQDKIDHLWLVTSGIVTEEMDVKVCTNTNWNLRVVANTEFQEVLQQLQEIDLTNQDGWFIGDAQIIASGINEFERCIQLSRMTKASLLVYGDIGQVTVKEKIGCNSSLLCDNTFTFQLGYHPLWFNALDHKAIFLPSTVVQDSRFDLAQLLQSDLTLCEIKEKRYVNHAGLLVVKEQNE